MSGGWTRFVNWLNGPENQPFTITGSGGGIRSGDSDAELSVKLLMLQSACDLLASNMAACEFRLYENGEPVKNREYFRLNVRPNRFQTASDFWSQYFRELILSNEVLIVSPEKGGLSDLYIAESFTREQTGLKRAVYSGVAVNGETLPGTFSEEDVMYLRGGFRGMAPLLMELGQQLEKITGVAVNAYARQGGEHGVLNMDAAAAGNDEQMRKRNALIKEQFSEYFAAYSAVLPLNKGYSYTPTASAHRNTSEINDANTAIELFAKRLSSALRVPAALLLCNNEENSEAFRELIAMGVAPRAKQFQEEYNSKRIGSRRAFANGSRLLADTVPAMMQHPELMTSIWEKGIYNGIYSVDELRSLRGLPEITGDYGDQHWITLNVGALGGQNDSTIKFLTGEDPDEKPEAAPETGLSRTGIGGKPGNFSRLFGGAAMQEEVNFWNPDGTLKSVSQIIQDLREEQQEQENGPQDGTQAPEAAGTTGGETE